MILKNDVFQLKDQFYSLLLAEHYKAVRVGGAALALVGAAVLSGVVAAAKAVAGAAAALLLR